ncbi:MAG: formimidoylglutamate deiminase [Rudaea sp.]
MTQRDFYADAAWLPHGWGTRVRLGISNKCVAAVAADSRHDDCEYLGRYVLPGMPNLHSHAFQRAMAGLTECSQPGSSHEIENGHDNFWTWRETMYSFAGRIAADDLRAIAAQLYVEMLKAGYTQVCEFHYLHHQPDGKPYADPAEMSLALIEAARETGIGLTLLPVLYMTGGFDGRPLSERQRRFGHSVDAYLELLQRLQTMENSALRVGVALHSLRAVPHDAMHAVLESALVAASPIHIHIAEQIGEVQDCLALRNARPVEWLLDNAPVDEHWCLVHATHLADYETQRAAATGAVAGLCPTTEANLGDGLFPLKAWLDADGRIGIGSDSHISVSPIEELRWLEYGQRLTTRHRNIAASALCNSSGESLWGNALFGGAQAAGVNIGAIQAAGDDAAGTRADLLVLDDDAPMLAARTTDNAIDTFIFAGNANLVRDVMVAGEWVVRDFHHRDEQRIAACYGEAVGRLARGN